MVSIEENIELFYTETERSVDIIIAGSDEHLDLILSIKNPLDKISDKFSVFNSTLDESLPQYTDDQLQSILPRLKKLNRSCMTLIGAIKTCFLYRDVRESLKKYTKNFDILAEVIFDIQNIRLAKDEEFDSILKQVNDL